MIMIIRQIKNKWCNLSSAVAASPLPSPPSIWGFSSSSLGLLLCPAFWLKGGFFFFFQFFVMVWLSHCSLVLYFSVITLLVQTASISYIFFFLMVWISNILLYVKLGARVNLDISVNKINLRMIHRADKSWKYRNIHDTFPSWSKGDSYFLFTLNDCCFNLTFSHLYWRNDKKL